MLLYTIFLQLIEQSPYWIAWFWNQLFFHCLSLNMVMSFQDYAVSEQISTVRRYVLRLARGTCKCVCKTVTWLLSQEGSLAFFAFQFLWPKFCTVHSTVILLSEMTDSSHQCLADGFDVICRNTPCCTKVDVLLYKMSLWLSLGSSTNL